MHEMSLCENLVQIIEQQAEIENFHRVRTVFLDIGVFAGVEIDSLHFCFDIVCQKTIADSAQLVINQLPAKARCLDCQQAITLADRLTPCPRCHGYHLQYLSGDEMRINKLEVD